MDTWEILDIYPLMLRSSKYQPLEQKPNDFNPLSSSQLALTGPIIFRLGCMLLYLDFFFSTSLDTLDGMNIMVYAFIAMCEPII